MSNPEIRNIQRIADIERRYQEVINSLLLDHYVGYVGFNEKEDHLFRFIFKKGLEAGADMLKEELLNEMVDDLVGQAETIIKENKSNE